MPVQKVVYVCPVCRAEYDDEAEAEECRDNHDVEEDIVYSCEGCGEYFSSYDDAAEHEMHCSKAPKSCVQCAHCDIDWRRHFPCMKYNFDRSTTACAHFEQARR